MNQDTDDSAQAQAILDPFAEEFSPTTEIEAHTMVEAAVVIHNRMAARIDALPWWRFGLRRGLQLALLDPGGAAFEWSDDADRLAEEPS